MAIVKLTNRTVLIFSVLALILLVVYAFGNSLLTKKVKGIVINDESSLPFAKVKVKATNNTSKTDYYGNFAQILRENDGIMFSLNPLVGLLVISIFRTNAVSNNLCNYLCSVLCQFVDHQHGPDRVE